MRKRQVKCCYCQNKTTNQDALPLPMRSGAVAYVCNEQCLTQLSEEDKLSLTLFYDVLDLLGQANVRTRTSLRNRLNELELSQQQQLKQVLPYHKANIKALLETKTFDYSNVKLSYLMTIIKGLAQNQTQEEELSLTHHVIKTRRDISDFLED